ncbi:hypothetical protein ABT300_18985 [Streptomyces sp. NPDC001027]|uniref:hypothetical protein n=1 Tax=Streptomyces sp. NPDC001027 TaxID=3154771 RepID=UPI00332D24FB
MGQATDAILVYGYDLGGPDEGWKVHGLGKYGELPPLDWYDEDADEDDNDFVSAVESRMLAVVAGFTEQCEPDARENGYYDRKTAAEKRIGVVTEMYCSHSSPMYALAAHSTTVHRGHIEYLDPDDMLSRPATQDWDSRLVVALDALGLTPLEQRPRWFLVSYGDL